VVRSGEPLISMELFPYSHTIRKKKKKKGNREDQTQELV
jgi:hypothetical protein